MTSLGTREKGQLNVLVDRAALSVEKALECYRQGYRAMVRAKSDLEAVRDALHPRLELGVGRTGRVTVPGRVLVSVGGQTLSLTKSLAQVLDILFKAQGWITLDNLLEAVRKRTGRPVSKRALQQIVYRLGRQLEIPGEQQPRGMIQSSRKFGYRLRPRPRVNDSNC